jgi:hypothetical protein
MARKTPLGFHTKKKCVERVHNDYGVGHHPCHNTAKFGEYCGVHDPEKRAERAAKRGPTQFERRWKAQKERQRRFDAVIDAARDILNPMRSTEGAETNLREALRLYDEAENEVG